MAKRTQKRKCPNCGDFFTPDYRNLRRQRYCSKPECRKAAKVQSQKRWLNKLENRGYFRGSTHVQRVQEWRKAHPGYARKKGPLQDDLSGKAVENLGVKPSFIQPAPSFATALQDIWSPQLAVLIGLISHLTGASLQDDIEAGIRRLRQLGNDILNGPIQNTGGINDQKATYLPPARAPDSKSVQLGGSPSGP